jgi:hypothetical protein
VPAAGSGRDRGSLRMYLQWQGRLGGMGVAFDLPDKFDVTAAVVPGMTCPRHYFVKRAPSQRHQAGIGSRRGRRREFMLARIVPGVYRPAAAARRDNQE